MRQQLEKAAYLFGIRPHSISIAPAPVALFKLRYLRINLSILRRALFLLTPAYVCLSAGTLFAVTLPTTDGFYGIWYDNQPGIGTGLYGPKYGGGLGTYPQQTSPIAIYSEAADKTFFVYGGVNSTSSNTLRNYISYYDHATGMVARPRELRLVGGNDVHMNATMSMDDAGYLWVYTNSHGDSFHGNLFKSTNPYEIAEFDEVTLPASVFEGGDGEISLAYTDPIYVPGQGHLLIWNKYDDGRAVHAATSTDGTTWINGRTGLEESDRLIKIDGHYQMARRNGATVGLAANYHPGGLNHRTNLYYIQTDDFAQSWTTVDGTVISGALTTPTNPALIHDYEADNQLVYMKDLNYDDQGNPIILFLTVSDETNTGHYPGPQPGGRTVHVAHWSGTQWDIHDVTTTDHNYDHGELYVDDDGTWRIIAPFLVGPQPWGTGGAIGVWESEDDGVTWDMVDQWTPDNTTYNHTYVRRPVNANDDFYAYWADGDAMSYSQSRLYFANKSGDVFQMPVDFEGDFAEPIPAPLIRSDLNHDNFINASDWLIFIAHDLTDVSGLSMQARYDLGDINYDGLINNFDFQLFKSDYINANGAGSFEAMLRSVPEPSTSLLLLLGLFGVASRRRPLLFLRSSRQ